MFDEPARRRFPESQGVLFVTGCDHAGKNHEIKKRACDRLRDDGVLLDGFLTSDVPKSDRAIEMPGDCRSSIREDCEGREIRIGATELGPCRVMFENRLISINT